jgi:spore germination protein YaaH
MGITFGLLALLFASTLPGAGYQVSAWTFGDITSLDQANTQSAIDEVNVDWYLSNRNGALNTSDENLVFVRYAQSRGVRVLATVSNYNLRMDDFDSALAHRILRSPQLSNTHIAAITRLCVNKGYDGIDLDWESVPRADRNRFSRFVQALAARLHNAGKLLSIAVHAKTSEPGDWFGAQSQDYLALGAAVDEFKVMTYDYSGSWSEPGPIAPPDWADEVLAFTETVVPAAKIMMGMPFYGYDWRGANATGVSWADVQALIAQYVPSVTRDGSGELTFSYTDGNGKGHTVFFQDRTAISVKLQMLTTKHPAIRGIAIWVMGNEDRAFWQEIAEQLH